MKNILLFLALSLTVSACQTVRQQDLDAWKGVPVSALDTHSIFLTMPMVKTYSKRGTEIRNYVNERAVSSCSTSGFQNGNADGQIFGNSVYVTSMNNYNSFQNCSAGFIACNNIFYIKDALVLAYKPTGKCFTDERAQPEAGWEHL